MKSGYPIFKSIRSLITPVEENIYGPITFDNSKNITTNKMKRLLMQWEKVFTIYISNKHSIIKICKKVI